MEIKRKLKYFRPETVFLLFGKHDKNVLNLLKEQVASKYLLRNYVQPYLKKRVGRDITCSNYNVPNICWIYWRQGIESAPAIVQRCVSSTIKVFQNSGWEIHVLNLEEAQKLCKLPDYIWDKYNQGKIGDAHLSDLIRLQLLSIYGGCWVDSTVLFTDTEAIPNYLHKREIFLFSNIMRNDDYINISNWLMCSIEGHPIITSVLDILLEYWRKEECAIQYYLFHLIFKMVTDYYMDYWKSLPVYSNIPPHIMQTQLYEQYSREKWNCIIENSKIHKLVWKTTSEIKKDSLYNHILQNDGERG